MRNIILILLEMIICYTSILLLNKKYKTDGLYVYAIIATFLSCIMSLKQIDILSAKNTDCIGIWKKKRVMDDTCLFRQRGVY